MVDANIHKKGYMMAGIYGIYSKKPLHLKIPIYNYFHCSDFENILNEEFSYRHMTYGRSVLEHFENDRILLQDDELIIGFEGLFYNKTDTNSFQSIKKMYLSDGMKFVEKIKGQFSGFIYDKHVNKLYLFTDHLSSKPLYVYQSDTHFIFASELKVITHLLSELNIKKELDYDGVYALLTFGYMLNDTTLEKNSKKLRYSTIMEIDDTLKVREKQYFQYKKEPNNLLSKKEIIEKIDGLLLKSVQRCWEKDDEYGYKHHTFLSGGLDSRVNLFLAKELGYKDISTLTFSQTGSSDQIIAQEISEQEEFKPIFYPLDNGTFLERNLHQFVSANDGLTVLSGSAAGYTFLSGADLKEFGALHTGQIGDLLFGSYVKQNFHVSTALMSNRSGLLKDISFWKNFTQKYDNHSELFGYEQRVINATLNGDRTLSHFVDITSPFYDRELINFCLSIPDRNKKDESIYLEWFNQKHPKISSYIWESAGIKPKNVFLVHVAKKVKRYKNALYRRLGRNINDMNPFDVWLRENSTITQNLNEIYHDKISIIQDKQLKSILHEMFFENIQYSHFGRNNKFLVITLLLAIELHFSETQ